MEEVKHEIWNELPQVLVSDCDGIFHPTIFHLTWVAGAARAKWSQRHEPVISAAALISDLRPLTTDH